MSQNIKPLIKHYISMNPREDKAKACSFLAAATHTPVADVIRQALEVFGANDGLEQTLKVVEQFYER